VLACGTANADNFSMRSVEKLFVSLSHFAVEKFTKK